MSNRKKPETPLVPEEGEFLVYQAEDGQIKLEVRLEQETLWLTQQAIAELLQTTVPNISMHIKNIYDERELIPEATVKDFLIVHQEGQRTVKRVITHYNLDMIISIGYRVKSIIATRFRIWATARLKEYIIKGFTMDDERLKNPPAKASPVPDYFNEWLERIRDIRSSEKRFYQKVRELYATAIDYDKESEQAQEFFKVVQNKMLWSVTGKTAAELIVERSDPEKSNMGLTSWQGAKVRKRDVTIAKNYLKEKEIEELNRIVTMYLDYAEEQARSRKTITMQQWAEKLNVFMQFNERDLLTHPGTVKAEVAKRLAENRYDEFHTNRLKLAAIEADKEDIRDLENFVKQGKGQ